MRRFTPLAVSLVLHGAVLAVGMWLVDAASGDPVPELVTIDVIESPRAPQPATAPERGPVATPPPVEGEPGEAGSPARRGAPGRRGERRVPPPDHPATSDDSDPIPAPPASVTDALGIEVGGEGLGGLSEAGLGLGGFGNGPGRGFGGDGDGRGGGGDAEAAAQRRSPKKSKARPARLIYPKRFRRIRPGQLFVVVLIVDEDGAVDGVKLKRGVNPHQDAKALDAVWRFRYEPALDDDGRPVRSKVEQQFMIDAY